MENSCKVKHVFPGGNTTQGFYSFYDYILPQGEANHIFCIKGGPGVGKSSLMKKIGQKMLDLGYEIEYHHCSSDTNSLDGIVIPKIKIAFIDGTSPHIVDPKNPGAVDEILNLGDFWNLKKIKENKKNIIETNKKITRFFNKAYQYLKAAKDVYDTYEKTESKAFEYGKYNVLINELKNEIFKDTKTNDVLGSDRHLFGYALTPVGIAEYRDTIICKYGNRYLIKDSPGASSELLMNEILNESIKRGLYIECYHSPIKIEKIEDILIPELDLSLSVVNDYHNAMFDYTKEIDLKELLNTKELNNYKDELEEDKEFFEMLLYKALNYISKAKCVHDELEKYYIKHMDFDEVNSLAEKLVNRIK